MIYSSIYANDDLSKYPSAIRAGIEYLKNTDFTGMEAGRYEINGDDMYALLMDVETAPVEKKRPESHKDYLDIQYVVSGAERQGVAPDLRQAELIESRPEKDIYFYAPYEGESFITVTAGSYTVFFPDDIHRPACMLHAPAKVRKVVLKIKMSAMFD